MKTLLIILSFIILSVVTVQSQTYNKNYADGMLYVKLKKPIDETHLNKNSRSNCFIDLQAKFPAISSIKSFVTLKEASEDLKLIYLIEFSDYALIDEIIKVLENDSRIAYVEKVNMQFTTYYPNDEFYNATVSSVSVQWYLDVIKAEQAWDISKGSADIKVAVIDNAVWAKHEDLKNKIVKQYNSITQKEGDSNPPTSVPADNSQLAQQWSHGTHCAGLVGAETNNNLGIASIGHNISIIGIRAANDNMNLSSASTMPGVMWAADNGAKVISMSYRSDNYSQTEDQVFQACKDLGIVLVAAAGNLGTTQISYPANYSSVIAVAATNSNDQLWELSEYGDWVDIAAPGGYAVGPGLYMVSTTYCLPYTLTSFPANKHYDGMSGTSMACPLTAGLCGLLLSKNPSVSPDQIKQCLISTSDPLSGSKTIKPGSGRINAYKAMQCVSAIVQKKPTANFTAYTTTIVKNGTVYFSDLSVDAPDKWEWTFEGGEPAFSNKQHPSVLYKNTGKYSVTLKVSNSIGSDTKTIIEYINVGMIDTICSTLHYPFTGTASLASISGGGGYWTGTNSFKHLAKAEYFETDKKGAISEASFAIVQAKGVAEEIEFAVWDNNGAKNGPGTKLGSTFINMTTIIDNASKSLYTTPVFNPPVSIDGSFYLGIILPKTSGNTLAVLHNKNGETNPGTAWQQQEDGSWNAMSSPPVTEGSWMNISMMIFPSLCNINTNITAKPVANFKASKTEIYKGESIEFTDLSTGTPTSRNWTFEGGTPSSSTETNPQVFYNTVGNFTVSLYVSNTLGNDTKTINSYVKVSESPVYLCDTVYKYFKGDWVIYEVLNKGKFYGYMSGNNGWGDNAKAEYFTNVEPYTQLQGVEIGFGFATKSDSDPNIKIVVWDNKGANSSPGNELSRATVKLSKIIEDVNKDKNTVVFFPSAIEITSAFFIGVLLPVAPGDTVVIYTNKDKQSASCTAWEQHSDDSKWYKYEDSWGKQLSHTIFPILCKTVINSVDNNKIVAQSCSIYPNPAKDKLFIELNSGEENFSITVFNLQGQDVYNFKINNNHNEIDISSLKAGVYFIKITNSTGFFTRKFIKSVNGR